MRYTTHVLSALIVATPVTVASDTLNFVSLAALSLGALFPDIDEPNSWIGRRSLGISKVIKLLFGHRGVTHSLIGFLLIAPFIALIVGTFNIPSMVFGYFMMGYLLHLVADSFSKSGVPWLLPFSKKNYQSGLRHVYYTTGRWSETVVLFVLSLVLIIELYLMFYM